MKKVYECSLMQVSAEQGFIVNSTGGRHLTRIDEKALYCPGPYNECEIMKNNDMYFGKLLVTKTTNRYFAKEIRTGRLIPLIHGSRELKYSDKEYLSHFFPFGRLHTYISDIKYKNQNMADFEHQGLTEVTDPEKVQNYLESNINKEEYLEKIENFFDIGLQKMQKKYELAIIEKEKQKKDSIKIKQLLKKI